MADTTAPKITRITLPHTIDLATGAQIATFAVEADDGNDGSGIQNVMLTLNHALVSLNGIPAINKYLEIGGLLSNGTDSFNDGTPMAANEMLMLDPITSAGTYSVESAVVYDKAGNSRYYTANDLAAAGLTSSFTITGSKVDQTPAQLLGVDFPDIDLSNGAADWRVTMNARDNAGGNGIGSVYFSLEKSIETQFGASQFLSFAGKYSQAVDDFNDIATPETAVNVYKIGKNTAPGTYFIESLRLTDASGNETIYYKNQLADLGFKNSFTVKGSAVDSELPTLIGLNLPSKVDLSGGDKTVPVKALAQDVGSGVRSVRIWFDEDLAWPSYSGPLIVLEKDMYDLSQDVKISSATAPGVYDIRTIDVIDKSGNMRTYQDYELKQLGITTRMEVTDGKALPVANAWLVPKLENGVMTLSVFSRDWNFTSKQASFDLTVDSRFLDNAKVKVAGKDVLVTTSSEIWDTTLHVTGSGRAARSGEALATITFDVKGDTSALTFLLENFKVGASAQTLIHYGDYAFQGGSAGADVITGAIGNDHVDAGLGFDIVRYRQDKAGYTVMKSTDGHIVLSSAGFVENLRNVERIEFHDKTIALETSGTAAQAYRVYQAAFDRKPDAGGLGFWIAQLEKGMSLNAVADGFLQSAEFAKLYGAQPSDTALVNGLYKNVLHRAGEAAGVKFWVEALAAGVSRADVLAAFSEGGENQAQVIGSIQNGIEYTPWLG